MNITEARDVQRLIAVLDGSSGGNTFGAADAIERLAARAAKALQVTPHYDAGAVSVALSMLRTLPHQMREQRERRDPTQDLRQKENDRG